MPMESRLKTRSAQRPTRDASAKKLGTTPVSRSDVSYGTAAHAVWSEALKRNQRMLANGLPWVHPTYLEGIGRLRLPARIPRLDEINDRLAPTGWSTVWVDGYIPTAAYVALMAAKVFPVSRMIRRPEHIDFSPAPDMVHDLLGHLPMLFSPEHRDYLNRLAKVMGRARPNALDDEYYEAVRRLSDAKASSSTPKREVVAAEERLERVEAALANGASELTHLRRIYVWSVEFGLTGTRDRFLAHGAALLSAPAEFEALCSGGPRLHPYTLEVIHQENVFSDLLASYFVASDFAQFHRMLSEYERRMQSTDRHVGYGDRRQRAGHDGERDHA